jgi:outer membrane cobalamin receptor
MLRFALGDRFQLRVHGQWISARKANASFEGDATQGKQLIYVPEFSGGAVATAELASWLQLTVTQQFTGSRYTTESNDRSLPACALTGVTAVLRWQLDAAQLLFKPEVLNLFDTSYEIAALYPMPGRQFRLSLTTEF